LRSDPTVVESLHFTRELGYRIKAALESGEIEQFGLLLDEHWQNKKRRSAGISNDKIDHWYDLAKQHGALGGKVVGAGGGGFLMLYCRNSSKAAVRRILSAQGLKEMPFDFDFEGAKVVVNF
jgi:D-glycero-alpha-D-manno-heptose-7-phosphate kinase